MSREHSWIDNERLWHRILVEHKHWTQDGTDVLMGNGQSAGLPEPLTTICKEAIEEIEKITKLKARHLMVNRLPAGVIVPVHTDPVLDNPTRWHLPLKTSIHCFHWDTKYGVRNLPAKEWHWIDYTIPHAIGNYGHEERVHLVVDLTLHGHR